MTWRDVRSKIKVRDASSAMGGSDVNRENWTVGEYAVRPAGKPGQCFYCHEAVGGTHKPECVMRQRTVVVQLTINLVRSVPESWTTEDVEAMMEESGCDNNLLREIGELVERYESHSEGGCACGQGVIVEAKFLREATEEDEKNQHFYVKDEES